MNQLLGSGRLACDCVPVRKAGGDYDTVIPRQQRKKVMRFSHLARVCVCVLIGMPQGGGKLSAVYWRKDNNGRKVIAMYF